MKTLGFIFSCAAIIVLASCQTINAKNPYPNMETVTYENNKAYEFINVKSDKLIIYIDGTSWYSVLGYKNCDKWQVLSFGYRVVNLLNDKYNILIPERLNMQIGTYYYLKPEMRRIYTLENLVKSYSNTINLYISRHQYSNVVLILFNPTQTVLMHQRAGAARPLFDAISTPPSS